MSMPMLAVVTRRPLRRLCSQAVEASTFQCRRSGDPPAVAAAACATHPVSYTTEAVRRHRSRFHPPRRANRRSEGGDAGRGTAAPDFPIDAFSRRHSSSAPANSSARDEEDEDAARIGGRPVNEFGHYYARIGGPVQSLVDLGEDEIHDRIRQRMHSRHARDFEKADDILEGLREEGVHVDDKTREWRADGIAMRSSSPVLNDHGHYYERIGGPADPSACTLGEDEIHALICERTLCKHERNFGKADSIRKQLKKCGVDIDDKLRQWRADGLKP